MNPEPSPAPAPDDPGSNPYAAPAAPLESAGPPPTERQIDVLVALNCVLAGLCALIALGAGLAAFEAVFGPIDEGGSPMADDPFFPFVAGLISAAALAVYLAAAFGLEKRRRWGYWAHLAGVVLAGLTCVGMVYTAAALPLSLRPGFRAAFPPRT
jgi:hypothetical protein